MFKFITSFHSEVTKEERAEVRSFPTPQPREITIEPWLRKALDHQKLMRKAADFHGRKQA